LCRSQAVEVRRGTKFARSSFYLARSAPSGPHSLLWLRFHLLPAGEVSLDCRQVGGRRSHRLKDGSVRVAARLLHPPATRECRFRLKFSTQFGRRPFPPLQAWAGWTTTELSFKEQGWMPSSQSLTRACISSSPPFLPKSRAFHDTVPTQVNSFWETFADLTPSLWRTQQV